MKAVFNKIHFAALSAVGLLFALAGAAQTPSPAQPEIDRSWAYAKYSKVAPSAGPDVSAPLELGKIAKGALDVSSLAARTQYWLVDLPAGRYKLLAEATCADDGEAINTDFAWADSKGRGVRDIGAVVQTGEDRARGVFAFELKEPTRMLIRVDDRAAPADYAFGVYSAEETLPGLFLRDNPAVYSLTLGQPLKVVVSAKDPFDKEAYCSISLPAGDYRLTLLATLPEIERATTGGYASLLSDEGVILKDKAIEAYQEGLFSARASEKLTLAHAAKVVFRLRPDVSPQALTFTVSPWTD